MFLNDAFEAFADAGIPEDEMGEAFEFVLEDGEDLESEWEADIEDEREAAFERAAEDFGPGEE